MITRRHATTTVASLLALLLVAGSLPLRAQPRRGEEDVRARQERYNQAIQSLQEEHNRQVTGVEEAFNAHRIDRRELDGDIASLQRQYDAGVAEQRRILEH